MGLVFGILWQHSSMNEVVLQELVTLRVSRSTPCVYYAPMYFLWCAASDTGMLALGNLSRGIQLLLSQFCEIQLR